MTQRRGQPIDPQRDEVIIPEGTTDMSGPKDSSDQREGTCKTHNGTPRILRDGADFHTQSEGLSHTLGKPRNMERG